MRPVLTIVSIAVVAVAPTQAQDSTRVYVVPEVVVQADAARVPWRLDRPVSTSGSVDDLMRHNGLALIQRASGFAGEVSMMGLRGAQLNATIDGMKVHAACVDKMDPNTAYVEIDNLSTMNVNADGSDLRYGQSLGGSVNFTLRQPRYGEPVHSVVDATVESNAFLRRFRVDVSGGTDTVALRAGYTLREANDMRTGDGAVVPISGYTKHNVQLAASWRMSPTSELAATVIADRATDVGYPSLIMDTRRADALLAAVTWRATLAPSLRTSVKLYGNTIDHTMDDYDRPLDEIRTRSFMPNMYMPMVGTATVGGLLAEASYTTGTTLVHAIVDATYLAANATMEMIPLDSTVAPMFMTNIGDARISTIGVFLSADHGLACDVSVRAGARIDVSTRTVVDPSFRSMYGAYYPGVSLDRTAVASSINAGVFWSPAEDLELRTVVAYSERLPTHLEMYGFWLYDPQANIVTNGRPDLANESALSATLGASYRIDDLTIQASGFVRGVDGYIAPDPASTIVQPGQPPIRTMNNIGAAFFTGIDCSVSYPVYEHMSVQGSVRGVWGKGVTVNDALPLINPLTASIRTVVGDPTLQGELVLTGAIAQNRVSTWILPEDTTPGWFRMDLLGAWRPTSFLRLQASCTNVFNTFYHEHTSINNLAARGRSFNVDVRVEL